MSKAPISNYVDSLHKQIADIAVKIKQKHQKKTDDFGEGVYELRIKSPAVQNQAYKLVDDKMFCSFLGQNILTDSGYVADTYNHVANSDKKSTVVEGLEFKNNKEYDFKV
ncbi:MAG: hypothetical protein IKC10_02625 [Alphaproteobacteria bacterium]|nr:hypothetical protein [Alphaproteobacteria bacterium]